MFQVIHESVQVARKKYNDDMWEQFNEWVKGGLYVSEFRGRPICKYRFVI